MFSKADSLYYIYINYIHIYSIIIVFTYEAVYPCLVLVDMIIYNKRPLEILLFSL